MSDPTPPWGDPPPAEDPPPPEDNTPAPIPDLDPERVAQFRQMGLAVTVDTEDPPGKTTVVFDTPDVDRFLSGQITARGYAEGFAAGRQAGSEQAGPQSARAARRTVARVLLAARQAGGSTGLSDAVDQLADANGARDRAPRDPVIYAAGLGSGPSTGAAGRGRLRGGDR